MYKKDSYLKKILIELDKININRYDALYFIIYLLIKDNINNEYFKKYNFNYNINEKIILIILSNLDKIKLLHPEDTIGALYECFIIFESKRNMQLKGQFYTNKNMIKYIINDMDITKDKIICDPCCGSASFIIEYINIINKKYDNIQWENQINNILLYEIDNEVVNIAQLNILNKINLEININNINSLYDGIDNSDYIVSNPPFGIKNIEYNLCCNKIKDLKILSNQSEILFIELILSSLNKDGKAAIILPIMFLNKSHYKQIREYIINKFNLKKILIIIDCPFINTMLSLCILFIDNTGPTNNTEYYIYNKEINNNYEYINISKEDMIKNNYNYNYELYKIINNNNCILFKDIFKKINRTNRAASVGQQEGQYPFFTSSNIIKYSEHKDYYGALYIGMGGQPNINYCEGWASCADHVQPFELINNNYNIKYIYYYLKSNNYNLIKDLYKGSTIKHISLFNIYKIPIPIITLEEQNKIINLYEEYYNNKKNIEYLLLEEKEKLNNLFINNIK